MPPPRQTIVHNTLRQTVVHLHPVSVFRHTTCQVSSVQLLRTDAFLFVLSQHPRLQTGFEADPSRPTQAAQRIVHIFSKESAQRQLRPFYSAVVRSVLREEQDRYRSKPSQAISLIWNLFGRRQAFRTLTRFYLGAVEKLGSNYYPALTGPNALYLAAGVVLHSRVYQRYVRQLFSHGQDLIPMRYAAHERVVADDLIRLLTVRHALPSREALEQLMDSGRETHRPEVVEQPYEMRLSGADFRALVQGVATSLSRQTRLESLRRGGM